MVVGAWPYTGGMETTPSHVIAITGARGKTCVACMLRTILDGDEAYRHVGIACSLGIFDGIEALPGAHGISETDLAHRIENAAHAGLEYMVVELHGPVPAAPAFDEAIVIDLDGGCVYERAGQQRTLTFSAADRDADVWASEHYCRLGVVSFAAHTPTWMWRMTVPLPGRFNISNALAVIAACELLAIPPDRIVERFYSVRVPGRMELVLTPDRVVSGLVDCGGSEQERLRILDDLADEFPDFDIIVVCDGDHRDAIFHAAEQAYASPSRALVCMFDPSDAACQANADIFNEAVRALSPGVDTV